ncbi:ATP-dependent Clp protease adapter ClpS [Zhihengliuella sp.]|uniref:ATP-dependent Clp protease adapter ClpS n=1 Tax=Zhihengliuella sp. TaxID=1954483 RepID=UPI002811A4B1|nr:ATP-dependent Clp protease adapter ClpS [Zhihengliuella sp.]
MPVLTPETVEETAADTSPAYEIPYVLIVWNDPVNLMSYVSWVFRSYFGYSKAKADELMMEVHTLGRSVVATGSLEKIEADVAAMHRYGLWATFKRADEA